MNELKRVYVQISIVIGDSKYALYPDAPDAGDASIQAEVPLDGIEIFSQAIVNALPGLVPIAVAKYKESQEKKDEKPD